MRIEPITISITTTRRNDVQSATITYRRSLEPWQRYSLITRGSVRSRKWRALW